MIVIGEKINATRKSVRQALLDKNMTFLQQLCKEQEEAGADYIDVNVGTGQQDTDSDSEADAMRWLVKGLEEATDKPLCIDSDTPAVIEAGVAACTKAVPMINSVNGSAARLKAILPLAAKYSSPVIALAMEDGGIPATSNERVNSCKKILEAAMKEGVPNERIYFDPLVLPLSTGEHQGQVTLDTLALLKGILKGTKSVVGLSNISFGLPRRALINGAFLTMAIGAGLDAVILDPTNKKLISSLRAAEVVAGKDRRCRRYLKAHSNGVLAD